MDGHFDDLTARRYREAKMAPDELARIAAHAAECSNCAAKLLSARERNLTGMALIHIDEEGALHRHVPYEMIVRYIEERASDDEFEFVRKHAARCSECREAIADLKAYQVELPEDLAKLDQIAAGAGLRQEPISEPSRVRAPWRLAGAGGWLRLGGAALVGAAATLLFGIGPIIRQMAAPTSRAVGGGANNVAQADPENRQLRDRVANLEQLLAHQKTLDFGRPAQQQAADRQRNAQLAAARRPNTTPGTQNPERIPQDEKGDLSGLTTIRSRFANILEKTSESIAVRAQIQDLHARGIDDTERIGGLNPDRIKLLEPTPTLTWKSTEEIERSSNITYRVDIDDITDAGRRKPVRQKSGEPFETDKPELEIDDSALLKPGHRYLWTVTPRLGDTLEKDYRSMPAIFEVASKEDRDAIARLKIDEMVRSANRGLIDEAERTYSAISRLKPSANTMRRAESIHANMKKQVDSK